MTPNPLQVTSMLKTYPESLPFVAMYTGFFLLFVELTTVYLDRAFDHWDSIGRARRLVVSLMLAGGLGAGSIRLIHHYDLHMLFAFNLFFWGQAIQGAAGMRIYQKLFTHVFVDSASERRETRPTARLRSLLRPRLISLTAAMVIVVVTTLAVVSALLAGTDDLRLALERFWIGVFFFSILGLVSDGRYFAHKLGWTITVGLVLCVAGAFLYSPFAFSDAGVLVEPYLESPVPDWLQGPLSTVGTVVGVFLWIVFYRRRVRNAG